MGMLSLLYKLRSSTALATPPRLPAPALPRLVWIAPSVLQWRAHPQRLRLGRRPRQSPRSHPRPVRGRRCRGRHLRNLACRGRGVHSTR